jgi:mRNA interferase RelE/StbE
MFKVRLLDEAERQLAKLDATIAKRLIKRITWLAANFEDARREALTGDLAGLFKFRVGDYRIIFEILTDEQEILIHFLGHRRDVYRR